MGEIHTPLPRQATSGGSREVTLEQPGCTNTFSKLAMLLTSDKYHSHNHASSSNTAHRARQCISSEEELVLWCSIKPDSEKNVFKPRLVSLKSILRVLDVPGNFSITAVATVSANQMVVFTAPIV